jgi:3-oxoacyl-[acyl-carrier protein] reductase
MHSKKKMIKKIILIGASSELAQAASRELSKNYDVLNLSRKSISNDSCKNKIISEYSTPEINKFLESLNKSDSHAFVFFNGISDSEIFINSSDEEINAILNTNLSMPILFTKAILQKFIPKRTKYIYLTSTRALNGDKGIAMYSTTKGALKYLARSLSLEYGKFNQYFHVISLGIFDFGLIHKVNKSVLDRIKKNSAIGDYVDIQNLAKTIEFTIQSDAATGSVVHVDNGYF